nr:MAG TPA: hypothetical protein [Bacteriophage sp.]
MIAAMIALMILSTMPSQRFAGFSARTLISRLIASTSSPIWLCLSARTATDETSLLSCFCCSSSLSMRCVLLLHLCSLSCVSAINSSCVITLFLQLVNFRAPFRALCQHVRVFRADRFQSRQKRRQTVGFQKRLHSLRYDVVRLCEILLKLNPAICEIRQHLAQKFAIHKDIIADRFQVEIVWQFEHRKGFVKRIRRHALKSPAFVGLIIYNHVYPPSHRMSSFKSSP